MAGDRSSRIVVRGTEIPASDPQSRRHALARVTLDALTQFVGLLDVAGAVLEMNSAALDAVGLTLADVAGRPLWTTRWWQVTPESKQQLQDMLARAALGEIVRWDTEIFCCADGDETALLDAALTPVRDDNGRVVFLALEGRYLTVCDNDESRLARQLRPYEAILNNTPDLAYVFDLEHRFIYANEGLLAMWGKSWDEAIGKTCHELGYETWHALLHDREIEQVVATKQPIRGEVPFHGTFGRRIYDYIFVPVLGPNGKVEAVAGTTRDVTERKEADRRKDEFLATLAHELRNPLAPIRNSIQILSLAAADDSMTQDVCRMMERQVNHMVRLVDDLLEISRITRGAIELRREPTSLAAVVRSAVDTSTPIIAAGRHQLTIDLPPEPLIIDGDAVRLSQVVSNLLSNAAKYTDPGGHIQLSVARTPHAILLRVRDNGIGIPAAALPHVFEMFMQVERATPRAQGGLGIGLTLVKRLVEMHGGKVTVHSDGPGLGSEFFISLPPAAVEKSPEEPRPPAPPPKLRDRVLVVDDNRDAADSLAMLIKLLGAEVSVAHDGPNALEAIAGRNPQLVFLDLGMPGMDGLETARRARALPGGDRLLLIALTGWGQEEDRKRTREAGFDHHLVKPVSLPELQAILKSLAETGTV